MRSIIGAIVVVFSMCVAFSSAMAACTGKVIIQELAMGAGGWTHILIKDMADTDIMNCGPHTTHAFMFNFNDSYGTSDGKKMLYSALLAATTTGKEVMLCSTKCDSQHPTYTTLTSMYY